MHEVHWPIIIAIYLFLAGVGVAAFYTGILSNLFGNWKYRKLAKYGSYIGVPLIIIGVLLLLADLGRPFYFWHFLLTFKLSSTMSIGVWLLSAFVIFGGLNMLTWLAEEDFAQNNSLLGAFKGKEGLRSLTGYLGIILGILTAAYTGVLLASTSAALWSSTQYLGLLFLVSATSTGMAALMLVLAWRKEDIGIIHKLAKADMIVVLFEIIVLALMFSALSASAPAAASVVLGGSYAIWFWVGIIGCGLVLPVIIDLAASKKAFGAPMLASILVLVGGFLLRYVMLYAGQVGL